MRGGTLASRLLAPAAGLALFGVFALLHSVDHPLYMSALTAYGIGPTPDPFLDTGQILSVLDCARAGIDVYVVNPCDVYGRVQAYSPLWLELRYLPITAHAATATGICADVLFLLSLCFLPRPLSWTEQWVRIAAILSPMTVYVLERGNGDLVIYLLVFVAGILLSRPGRGRFAGYPVLLFAALLKYYPFVTLAVALRERRAAMLTICVCSTGVAAIFFAVTHTQTGHTLAALPRAEFYSDSFAAMNLPWGIGDILARNSTHPIVSPGAEIYVVIGLFAALIANTLIAAISYAADLAVPPEGDEDTLGTTLMPLLLGALIIVGCFAAWQNVYYRGIYFLLLLPGFYRAGGYPGAAQTLWRSGTGLILLIMWSEPIRQLLVHLGEYGPEPRQVWRDAAGIFWLLRELVWWRLIAILAGILLSRALPLLSGGPRRLLSFPSERT